MTKAQKENQARFKMAQAEAKKLKAKNPKLKHTEAVKQAFAKLYPSSSKKVGAVKNKVAAKNQTFLFDVIKKPIGLYYDNKLIKQFDTVAQANKYQIQKVGQGYNRNLFFTQKFPLAATRKSGAKKQTGKTNIAIDRKIQAKSPGKRISKEGNVYYEARANRSDKGRLLGVDYYGEGKKISSGSLVKGKKYEWILGAGYNEVKFIGLAYKYPKIKASSSYGKGYLFEWVDEPKKYVEVSAQGILQAIRTIPSKKVGAIKKKPAVSKHKNTKSHNVKISVMSGTKNLGVGKFDALKEYKETLYKIAKVEKIIFEIKATLPNIVGKINQDRIKKELVYVTKLFKEYKTHARELKKLL